MIMSPKKEDCITKIKRQIKRLKTIPPEIRLEDADLSYGAHTIKKLIFLNYYIGIFLTIARSHSKGKIIFIDAFGGTGLVKIKNTNVYVKGSSLCAALAYNDTPEKPTFDEIYSFEINPERYQLLKKRFDLLQQKVKPILHPINEDVNIGISKISLTHEDYVLLFIDPEGLEPDMINFIIFALQSSHVDIILNISSGVKRVAGLAPHNQAYTQKLKRFLPNYKVGMDVEEVVNELFEKYFKKTAEVTTTVTSKGKREVYKLTLRVRETKSGSPFVRGMRELSECLNGLDGKKIGNILRTGVPIERWIPFNLEKD